MHFTLAALTTLSTLSTISLAAPNPISATRHSTNDLAPRRFHRALCTITGTDTVSLDSSGRRPSTSASASLDFSCSGEDADGMGYSSDNEPNNQTLDPEDTGLPYGLEWWLKREIGGYDSCWAKHGDGEWVEGTVDNSDITVGLQESSTTYSCSVEFNVYGDCPDAVC
ncbi:hypothetical protein BDV96DRAFT_654479 [Lophiotrema nucula]|uniref:Ig-like domain-containing protein n=1 Tax=Lophiotrema nucula TaxID=690887 RepID=A0A6A5YHG4_9PLEO|nr:hypothetical protein BDV96DRAFT_654479 [Lophiotrema nucula]